MQTQAPVLSGNRSSLHFNPTDSEQVLKAQSKLKSLL